MGMDVYGKNAKSKAGEYFRNNVWWWRPLWDYCCKVAPDIITPKLAEQGHYNDGAGLSATKAKKLADRLEEELTSGRTADYERARLAHLESLPDQTCEYCKGTGKRQDLEVPNGCNSCKGTGKVRPYDTWYPFTEENVREFSTFLRDSGGFRIY